MKALKLLLLVCLSLIPPALQAEDFYYKTNYYGNGFIGGEFTFTNGTIHVKNQLSTVTCPEADCTSRFTLGGALTWLPDHSIVDASVTSAKVIAPFATTQQASAERFASVALEPNARFALYTAYSPACGKQIVKSQRFNNNTGSKIGPPKVLLDCAAFTNSLTGAYGLDLVSTGESESSD